MHRYMTTFYRKSDLERRYVFYDAVESSDETAFSHLVVTGARGGPRAWAIEDTLTCDDPPKARTVAERIDIVSGRLRARIFAGEYRPGHKFPPRTIWAEIVGLSRTSALERALAPLLRDGLLKTSTRGTTVAPITQWNSGPVVTEPGLKI